MGVPSIGQVKMKEDFPQFLYHKDYKHARRVDTAEQKMEALKEGWNLGYLHKEYPKAMYSATGDYKEVDGKEEEDELRGLGWESDPALFTDLQIVSAKVKETEQMLKDLKGKQTVLRTQPRKAEKEPAAA
jgi:uncharacterized protein YecA (UPF0149 family)